MPRTARLLRVTREYLHDPGSGNVTSSSRRFPSAFQHWELEFISAPYYYILRARSHGRGRLRAGQSTRT